MMELNREKIIKGLECCHDLFCNKCPYTSMEWCAKQRITDTLALIKELAEENERLRSDVVGQLEAEVYSSDKYIDEYDGSEVQKAYNKGLRDALKIAKELLEENNV